MNPLILYLPLILSSFILPDAGAATACASDRVQVQVLGSGGPELTDQRASTSYLVWLDGKARIMLDAGSGSALRFESSGALFATLDVLLFSHFHSDHSTDLPSYVMGAFFSERDRDLPVIGPSGADFFPSTETFLEALVGNDDQAAFHYLGYFLDPKERSPYKLRPRSVPADGDALWSDFKTKDFSLSAIPVHHGPVPALAWRVDIAGCAITFTGDMNGLYETLPRLAQGSDLLVAHNAIPEGTLGFARILHMPPSVIGKLAAESGVKRLVLSHRMMRTLGKEQETLRYIRTHFKGPVEFADDLDRFRP